MDAFTITLKDLLLLTRDRRALIILVAMPMVIIAIVGGSTGRLRTARLQNQMGLQIEVADLCNTAVSQRLSGFLAAYDSVLIRPMDLPSGNPAESRTLVRDRPFAEGSDARLIIGPQFEELARAIPPRELTSPDETTRTRGLDALDLELSWEKADADPMMKGLSRALIALSLQNALLPVIAEKVPVFRGAARNSVIPEAWERTPEARTSAEDVSARVYQFFIPSYTVLFVFFLVNIMGRSIIGERESGTLRRLQVAPISPTAILVGKTLPFLVLSLVQTVILLISGKLLFGMSWGAEPLLLLPVMLCTSAAATALGLLFSTVAQTESQVSSMGNLILLSCAGISGCLVPRDWMPPLTRQISLLTPHAWALDAYGELLTTDAPSHHAVAVACGVLLLFAAAFFVLGLLRFRVRT
jgi:ABC-2 type transport system permease protein